MSISRRSFIRNSAFTIAGSTLLSNKLLAAAPKGELTGVQLYSIRDEMKANPLATLQELANMVCFIVSPQNSFTTGFTFDLSGGRATY